MNKTKIIGGILGPLLFIYLNFFFTPEGLSPAAQSTLACAARIAVWWTMESDAHGSYSTLAHHSFPHDHALH